MTEVKKTFIDPIVVRTKGICPTEITDCQLPKIQSAINLLATSIEKPVQNIAYPDPILEKMPEIPLGWPGTEEKQARLFGHIFSGTYLKESGLEGSSYFDISQYFEKWFQHFAMHAKSDDVVKLSCGLIPQLQSLQFQEQKLQEIRQKRGSPEVLREAAIDFRKSVLDLRDGEVYLMNGGWQGTPGHAILYEFKRVGNSFEMRIFNTGAGTEKHVMMLEGTKQKISPVLCKSAIPSSAFTIEFFQSLLEPQVLPAWNLSGVQTNSDECQKIIYEVFFFLEGTLESSSGFITSQRSGTCACDSLLSYIRYRIGENKLGLYEQILLAIRKGTLSHAWDSWSGLIQKKEKSYLMSLLERGAQKLISDSIKPVYLKEDSWFSTLEMEQARALGSKVQLSLARTRAMIKEEALKTIKEVNLSEQRISTDDRGRLLQNFSLNSSSDRGSILFKANILPITDPRECKTTLKTHLATIQAECHEKNTLEMQTQLQWLVDSLPIPTSDRDDFWQKVPDRDVHKCSELLETILTMYFERLQPENLAVMPEEQNVFFALLTILHTLARRDEKINPVSARVSLDQFKIGDPTALLENDPYTVFFSPATKDRREKILNYFSKYNHTRVSSRSIHDFANSFADFPFLDKDIQREFRKRDEFQYYLNWIQQDRSFEGKMHHVRPGEEINWSFKEYWNDLSVDEKNAFRLMFDPCIAFQKNGRQVHAALRKAALISHLMTGNWKVGDWKWGDDQIQCKLQWDYGDRESVKRTSYLFTLAGKKYEFCQKQTEDFRSKQLHSNQPKIIKTRKEPEFALRSHLRTEGEVLPQIDVRNAEEPNARPIHVLQKSLHEIPTFKKKEEQIAFLIDFFRSHLTENRLITPVKDLSSRVEFLKICEDFFSKGINYYWNFPRKQDRDTSTTLFFIKVALELKKWIPEKLEGIPHVFTDGYIQQFLRQMIDEGISDDDIHLYLLLSHENDKQVTEKNVEEIIHSWFLLDRHFTKKETVDLHTGASVQNFIWRNSSAISKLFEKSPALCQKVADLIWKAKGNVGTLKWTYYPSYRAFYAYAPNGDEIALDLQSQALRVNKVDLYKSKYLPSEVLNVPGFERLFKDRKPSEVECSDGKIFRFTDSVWGEIEVQFGNSGGWLFADNRSRIIRKDAKGNQYYFCSDLDSAKDSIPIAIRKEAILWIPLKSRLPWSLHDQDTGDILYDLDPSQQISKSSWQLIQTQGASHQLEGKGGVLTWVNPKKEKLIVYPFLSSRNGQSLKFDVTTNGVVTWKENPEYLLAREQQQGLLGSSSQYLLLENKETGTRKILVPMHRMQKDQILSCSSFFKREFSFSDSSGKFQVNNQDENPETSFFAFDLEGEEILGQNPVENLYLMYLFITQRNYKLAHSYFEKIEKRNRFTKEEWKDLYKIAEWMRRLDDRTPEAVALMLKTWDLINKERTHPDFHVPEKLPIDEIGAIFREHLESTNQRSSIVELTPLEERNWQAVFKGEARAGVHEAQNTQIALFNWNPFSSLRAWISPVINKLSTIASSFSYLGLPTNRTVERYRKPDLYFLSVIEAQKDFYQYYHWIRTGTLEFRENLAAILHYHLLKGNSFCEYSKVLLFACHVKNVSALPELRDFDKWEDCRANFENVIKAIRWNTSLSNIKGKTVDSAYLGTQTTAPLSHLKIHRGEIEGRFETKQIPLPEVLIPKVKSISSLEEETRKVEETLRALEDKILSAAHPESKDPLIRRKEQAAILAGHYGFPISMATLFGLFLEGTYDGFKKAIPRMNYEEIDRLNLDIQDFLIKSAYLQQIKRARGLAHSTQFLDEVNAECSYPSTFRPGLVFEVVSNKRLRPLQSSQLQEMVERMDGNDPFLLTHMIMGGGKTDVFASLLGRLWARKDQLSLFLTPASQLKTVQGNLATSQWKCFGQGTCTFDYQRQDLTLEILKDIRQELLDAMECKRLVILRSEMPQILELEYISQLFESAKDIEKIRVLKEILNIFRKKTAVIIDEADEVFRTDRETNFPSGEKVTLDVQHISFISSIFRRIAIDLRNCSIQEKLAQLPALLVDDPVFAKIPQHLRGGFLRYLKGEIECESSTEPFLAFRDEIIKTDLQIGHLIALARHLVQEILPHTLQKTTRRDFGRLNNEIGKVVPYLAAGIPATTEFGHPWELAAYHFQTALTTDISLPLINHVIEIYFAAAKEQSTAWNCPIADTPIFHEWKERFNVSLFDVQELGSKQEFLKKINQDVHKKLYIEEKLIQHEVLYDPNYYSSNGHNLMMFPKVLAMTGTPYNRGSYPSKLGNKPLLDLDSVEKLKRTLIERNGEVHTVEDLTSAEKTLTQVLKDSKSSENLRALIDVGGCLLKKSNFEYANEMLTVFANEKTVQGVVFFQGEGKSLALLKKGEQKPISLIDTHLSTWKAQGVDPSQLFFFYDHLHSRGTDFPLPPKTVALTLLKKDDELHDILQGVARCRKLMTTQNVIYAVDEKDLNIEKILERSAQLEKDLLRDQIYRHYIQEMDHVVRACHMDELTAENPLADLPPAFLSIDHLLRPEDPRLLRVSHPSSPYHEFGKVPSFIQAIEGIKAHAETLMNLYSFRYPSAMPAIRKLVLDAVNHLEDLPESVESQAKSLGREKHLQKEIQKQVEKENEKLLELEREWLKYQNPARGRTPKEAQWTEPQANSLCNQKGETLDLSKCAPNGPLKTLLNDAWYQNRYPDAFDDNLYATTNWHQKSLPIFSKYHKPALQMLVVEHGREGKKKYSGVLLSLAETEFFRATWCPKQVKDMRMWLINADGHLLTAAKSPLPDNAMVDRLLIQMNMLNGHIDWTTKNIEKSVSWITEDSSKSLIKIRLCYLQAMKEKEKAAILLDHPKLKTLEQKEVTVVPPGDPLIKRVAKTIIYFTLIVFNKWGNMVIITLRYAVQSARYVYRSFKKTEAEI